MRPSDKIKWDQVEKKQKTHLGQKTDFFLR